MRKKKNQYIKNILLLVHLFIVLTVNMYLSALASNDFKQESIITLFVLVNVFFLFVVILIDKIIDIIVDNQGVLTAGKKIITGKRILITLIIVIAFLFIFYSVYATGTNDYFLNYKM